MTQQRKRCGKGGFTLVELVVTLVILSILFAIAVPSLLGYIHLSQFRKNESYAKTMYLSAESELTYLRTGGEWESFCSKVKKEGVLNQSFDESDEDRKKLVGRIYGIRLDAGNAFVNSTISQKASCRVTVRSSVRFFRRIPTIKVC